MKDLKQFDILFLNKNSSHMFLKLQPGLDESTRKSLGETAVRAAKAVNYVGAGKFFSCLDLMFKNSDVIYENYTNSSKVFI